MLIVLGAYFGLVWLVFSKLRLLPWNALSKGVVYAIALVIALVVIGLLNHTTPTGPISVQGAVVEIRPNIGGTITSVEVKPNTAVQKGAVLFTIDATPQEADLAIAEATLESAKSAADQLTLDLDAAIAEIDRLKAQLEFGIQRRDDIVRLEERGASTGFQMQEAVSTIDQLTAAIRAAQARKASLERRIAAKIDDLDFGVIEARGQLAKAQWALDQTIVRAPADGEVTALDLRVGDRVAPTRGAVNFATEGDRALVASLPQSSRTNISAGDEIRIALRTLPGSEFKAAIKPIPFGSAEGVFAPRNGLPSLREIGGGTRFIITMEIPSDVPLEAVQLGASGSALIITEDAGAIAALAEILFWVSKMMNYL
ncbi:HlyD family secretion protein [Tropicibacter sp. Alg240-R139]|uniref:HlyD family secretion protein n=1 Tax=Tropicibacter sp. Alg240-R139 TaxID=2305991 RepID=UPI0013DF3F75|nr:biotin/lipoyl-binding protein [Tropicibacter sp. Alg240-R139]